MSDLTLAKSFLLTLRSSLDRIDAGFIFDLAELEQVFEPPEDGQPLVWKSEELLHPALKELVDALIQECLQDMPAQARIPYKRFNFHTFDADKTARLVQMLADRLVYRFKIVTQIGVIKVLEGLPVRDMTRWAQALEMRMQMATVHSLPKAKMAKVLEMIHESSCVWQELIQKLIKEGENFSEFRMPPPT